ncbi:MAG: hypothetical protein EA417_08805 [Gammaproteobacteria bacterium]|nr:MAG: hypothetical protein EA417_08805 [Gammaproteobacteria bacterium]
MRVLILLALLLLPLAWITADEPAEAPDVESETSPEIPAQEREAPVSVVRDDDGFLPTDQLRYDQEVDYPTDI